MKKLLSSLVCLTAALPAVASVNRYHTANKLVGDYRIEGKILERAIEFSIEKGNKIYITKWQHDSYEKGKGPAARLTVFTLDSEANGPEGLPVGMLALQYGSDEESITYHLRLAIEKEDAQTNRLVLIDLLRLANDGPNQYSGIQAPEASLLKKNRDGKFEPVAAPKK